MRSALKKVAILVAAAGLGLPLVQADEMIMTDGSRIKGNLVSADGGKIVFATEFAGEITVDGKHVQTLNTDDTATVLLADGEVAHDQRVTATQNEMQLVGADGKSVTYAVGDISKINPEPWELGLGYNWNGKVSTALKVERGNSDKNEFDLRTDTTWRSTRDRYGLAGAYEVDETNGEKNKDRWELKGKYDRFLSRPENYFGAQLYLESDQFADLDLRTAIGAYLGRQFLEGAVISIKGEIGLSYFDEQFDTAEDNDYPAATWSFDATSDYLGRNITLFAKHTGYVDLTEADAVLLDTSIGMSMPIYGGLQADALVRFEYDGGAVEGIDEIDETYEFRLGYAW